MAKVISLVQDQFGINGTVPLFIGDDWAIRCILNNFQPELIPDFAPVDLTGASCTAYFPATGGGVISSVGIITAPTQAAVTFVLPASATMTAQVMTNTDFYAVASIAGLQTTFQTVDSIIQINARQFNP